MRPFTNLTAGLRNLFRKERAEQELDEELRNFQEAKVEEHIRAGMTRSQAQRTARLEIGSEDVVKERVREVGWESAIESLWQDIRYGARIFRRSPGFTAAAVLTLALGIGANTAIFTVVNWLVLRPLPVQNPAQLVYLQFPTTTNNGYPQFSYPEFQDLQQAGKGVFSEITAFRFGGSAGGQSGEDGLTVNGETKSIQTCFVAGNFFSFLGIQPYLGRLILPGEGLSIGADPVVVLSYRYWRTRFAGDPNVIGKRALINGHPVTIVGIAPRNFYGLTPLLEMQAYLPLGMAYIDGEHAADMFRDRKSPGANVFARLRPGVTREQAQTSLASLAKRLINESPRAGATNELEVRPLRPPGLITGTNPLPALTALFLTLAALVLALAALNVTNLQMVRATIRTHEMAVRSALGARRSRLVRQMLTENLLLGLLGGCGGLGLGLAASHLLPSLPMQTELPLVFDFRLDWRVFGYTLLAALLAGALIGIGSALHAGGGNLSGSLHQSSRGFGVGRQRLRTWLVVVQVGGSLALLIAAGLFVRSLRRAERADLGFNPQHVLNLTPNPYQLGYTSAQEKNFYHQLLDRVRALPGAKSASLTMSVPFGEVWDGVEIDVPGYKASKEEGSPSPNYNDVSTQFFATLQMKLLSGRDFNDGDTENSAPVVVINQAMADHFWPHQNAIGKSFTLTSWKPKRTVQVVGVVANARLIELSGPIESMIFFPITQHSADVLTLQVRSDGDPLLLAPSIRQIISGMDSTMPVRNVQSMSEAVNSINGLLLFEIAAGIAGGLGLLGLVLAVVGVYGVISFSVSQRTQEIGIRMALGATANEILRMISRQSFLIVAGSIPLGLLAAFAVGKLLADFLVGVSPTDPLTYAAVTALLIAVALIAGYLPARRATRVNPMVALRHE